MHFRLHLTRRFKFVLITTLVVLLTLASPALFQFEVHASEAVTPNAEPTSMSDRPSDRLRYLIIWATISFLFLPLILWFSAMSIKD